jgi:hypothetical protein
MNALYRGGGYEYCAERAPWNLSAINKIADRDSKVDGLNTHTMLLASVVLVLAVASPPTGVPAVLITHYSDAQVLFAAPFTPPGPCNAALVSRDGPHAWRHASAVVVVWPWGSRSARGQW